MSRENNNIKYSKLRNEYNYFTYENYCYRQKNDILEITYSFSLADKYYFNPKLIIPIRDFFVSENMSEAKLSNLIFHIGMIELLSYWKAACPPRIIIKPFHLNDEQVNWWKKLYFYGLGEFFYLNSIDASQDEFVEIESASANLVERHVISPRYDMSKVIIPIGGGKDSIVTLNLLKESNKNFRCLVINPRQATNETIETIGLTNNDIIEIKRTIDPQLLKLNDKGFLNGHTPFSALLAFVSLLASSITGINNIALSNESSANESTIINSELITKSPNYQITKLPNHQYSKSFEFEKDFRSYVSKYISKDINYYSFLRPLNELQIASIFSSYTRFHNVFKSCNAGSKTDTWCCECPKCLFTYIILSPFIAQTKLENIFGENLLDSADFLYIFNQLIGIEKTKPFDCIGTIDEVNAALCMTILVILKELKNPNELPYLLKYYMNSENYNKYKDSDNSKLLTEINTEHFLSPELLTLIKSRIINQ